MKGRPRSSRFEKTVLRQVNLLVQDQVRYQVGLQEVRDGHYVDV
jgi:hypothetical protein